MPPRAQTSQRPTRSAGGRPFIRLQIVTTPTDVEATPNRPMVTSASSSQREPSSAVQRTAEDPWGQEDSGSECPTVILVS